MLDKQSGEQPARLLFGGHQNGLADPVLACVLLEPQLHFFTRADAFKPVLSRWFLLRLNMMPVYRPKDRVADMVERNQTTFAAAQTRLEKGATCGIFPEAGHKDERRIRRFRHGSARFVAGAMQREAIRLRGLELIPMNLDFERYAGYRTGARITLGKPVATNDIPGLQEDKGSARVILSHRMRQALIECSVDLTEGDEYDAHLAIHRFLEGARKGPVSPAEVAAVAKKIAEDPTATMAAFQSSMDAGMGHPRISDDFAAMGRITAHRPTRLLPLCWRFPAWAIFTLTTGWWPRVVERAAAKRVKEVAFRTTFSIPVTMVVVSLTWLVLALGAGVAAGHPLAVPTVLLTLRGIQHLAMPLEDAIIDSRKEKQVQSQLEHPFIRDWCIPFLNAPSHEKPSSGVMAS